MSSTACSTADHSLYSRYLGWRLDITGHILAFCLRLVNYTLSWKKIGLVENGCHWSEGERVIMVFWHGDQLMMPWVYNPDARINKRKDIFALVSRHNDGRIAAKVLEHFNVSCIDGSSTRGAAKALMQLKRKIKEGFHVALTPDGPKGPRYIAKHGAIILSSALGIPLLPIAVANDRSWSFKSWDGMFLPKPFSKMVALAGARYTAPSVLTREELAAESDKLTDSLNALKKHAIQLLGPSKCPP